MLKLTSALFLSALVTSCQEERAEAANFTGTAGGAGAPFLAHAAPGAAPSAAPNSGRNCRKVDSEREVPDVAGITLGVHIDEAARLIKCENQKFVIKFDSRA
jgi:hypothetical protein